MFSSAIAKYVFFSIANYCRVLVNGVNGAGERDPKKAPPTKPHNWILTAANFVCVCVCPGENGSRRKQ